MVSRRCDVTVSVLCQHLSSGICFNYVLSDKNDRPFILSDKNRGNGDTTCHQPVIYDVVTVNKHVSHVSSSTDMFQITVWTFLRAGKLYITDRRGPSTNVSYFHYRSGLDSCCFVDSTCHQPVMAASS